MIPDARKKKNKRRNKCVINEATLCNLEVDNKRLQGAIKLQEQQLKTLKSQQSAFDSLNLYLKLKMNSEYNVPFQSED